MSAGLESLRGMLRLAVRGWRAGRDGSGAASTAPRRRPAVERADVAPEPARIGGYLAATDGARIAAFRGAGAVLPPLFCATWQTAAALELLGRLEPPLPLGGLVHVEGETLHLRPIRPGDRVRTRLELERAEPARRGLRLVLAARHWNAAGDLCAQATQTFLALGAGGAERPAEDGERARREEEDDPGGAAWHELARWRLGAGAGRRYAVASGDWNPIHLWSWTARPFGFRRPVLHGLCTAARAAHALVERRFGGDPAALRRLRITFRAPLLLPAGARLLVAEEAEGRGRFRVVGTEDGTLHARGSFAGRGEGGGRAPERAGG